MKKNNLKTLFCLHLMLMIYSMSSLFSKKAASVPFLSFKFCFYYGMIILLLGFYAIGWQQIIKRLPLTTAYANKAITVIWGLIWGIIFFQETVTIGKLVGVLLVVSGVVLFSITDGKEVTNE